MMENRICVSRKEEKEEGWREGERGERQRGRVRGMKGETEKRSIGKERSEVRWGGGTKKGSTLLGDVRGMIDRGGREAAGAG